MFICTYSIRIFGYNTQDSGVTRARVSRSAVSGFDVSYDILKFTKSKIANLRYTILQSAIVSYDFHTVMVVWYSAGRIEQYLTVLCNSGPSVYYIITYRYWYSCRIRAVQLFYLGVSSYNISPRTNLTSKPTHSSQSLLLCYYHYNIIRAST